MTIKKILSIIIVFVLCINTSIFSAVVSDNDGSAFITKAEYDSLKNSFQSQIDSYNSSIDSKIDAAIASYLSGIKIESETNQTPFCYTSEGIIAPRSNYADLKWVEGTMNVAVRIAMAAGSTSQDRVMGSLIANWNGNEATEFTELSVTNVDYTNGYAKWNGVIKSKQYFFGTHYDQLYNGNHVFTTDSPQYASIYNGFFSSSNIDVSSSDTRAMHLQYSINTAGAQLGVGPTFINSRLTRDTLSTNTKSVVCVPQSVVCKRFSNVDEIRDWCNDTDTSDHTIMSVLSPIFDEVSSSATKTSYVTAGTRQGTQNSWTFDFHSSTVYASGITDQRKAKPYFGFVRPIENYNRLWTSNYDRYVNELKEQDSKIKLYTDKDGNQHLYLYSGAPIVKVDKDALMTIEMEFADKTKDYDVWFKYSGFNNVNANSDTDLVPVDHIYYGTNKNTKATVGSQDKSIKVPAGSKTITLEAEKDAYIFLKWSISGNSGAGGGTFMPPKQVKTKKAE